MPRRAPEANPSPPFGWKGAPAAILCLLAGLSPGSTGPSSLPDSVVKCEPCHNRGDRDQVTEWLASPYSETEGGRGCTDCHDRHCSGNEASGIFPDNSAALEPVPPTEAARLTVSVVCSGDDVNAEVAVSNVGVGHLLPTGSAKRTLILEVAAHDLNQAPLAPRDRREAPAASRAALGLPGRVPGYGTRSGATVTVQSRLFPFATDVSRYRFVAPESGPARVSARLLLVPATGPPSEIANTASVCRPSGEEP